MHVLGFDPGSTITGYGVIAYHQHRPSYIASGCIRLGAGPMPARLYQLYQAATQLLSQYAPGIIAVEKVFVKRNVDSALKLGQARGVLLAAAGAVSTNIYEYTPREIKQAVVGYGAAEKAQIQAMVQSLLSLSSTPQADAADALAIALCCIHQHAYQVKLNTQ